MFIYKLINYYLFNCFVYFLLPCLAATWLYYHFSTSLSTLFLFFLNLSIFQKINFLTNQQNHYPNVAIWLVKKRHELFSVRGTFLPSGERGIWTLAPVTRPTPLAGAPLQPLEYFSRFHNNIILSSHWLRSVHLLL